MSSTSRTRDSLLRSLGVRRLGSPLGAVAALVTLPAIVLAVATASAAPPLPETEPYAADDDLPERVLDGLHLYLLRQTERSPEGRAAFWSRDLSSAEAYVRSVEPNRQRLRQILGVVDPREPFEGPELPATTARPARLAATELLTVDRVRWPVVGPIHGEGLLLRPLGRPKARIVALSDADQTPEHLAGLVAAEPPVSPWALRLAEQGCEVIVPVLIDRRDDYSGNPLVGRYTNQPHREWIHRQAYQVGRHVIGYEVQKVLAAVDWYSARGDDGSETAAPIGVAGYGEGGLVAFHAAAVDPRIDACLVSGYFGPREGLWQEPLYRNVWRLLQEFGDAEIASLVAPRALIVEDSDPPAVEGPPAPRAGRSGAAPGRIAKHPAEAVLAEVERLRGLVGGKMAAGVKLIQQDDGSSPGPGSPAALRALLEALNVGVDEAALGGNGRPTPDAPLDDPDRRQARQVRQMEEHVQRLVRDSAFARAEFFWKPVEREAEAGRASGLSPAEAWEKAVRPFRARFRDEIIGRLPPPTAPNARSRLLREEKDWTGYLVVLDIWPDVITFGYLLLPNDLKPGERRPVVVCQHGLGGDPGVTIDPENRAYRAYGARLAAQGFVVFSPYQPNAARGHPRFCLLQRVANPLGASIYSAITAQHEQLLGWLAAQPFVDPERIGFYGLSYGGKTAVRVPAMLDGYALSICSGDYNEWVRKVTALNAVTGAAAAAQRFSSYMFTAEYEIMEFNLAHTFNYAEMAAMIAPRPFMVERGHGDLVGSDEWVAFEYAPVRRLYTKLGIPERTEIEWFDDGHVIHGQGTFEFLRRQLHQRPSGEATPPRGKP